MAIETIEVKTAVYEGTGAKTLFDITFPYFTSEDIVPYLYIKEENKMVKLPKAEFDLDLEDKKLEYPVASSGLEPLAKGKYLIIIRQTALDQLASSADKSFTSKDIEKALDKLTMITQELADCCSRSIRFNPAHHALSSEKGEFDNSLLDAQTYIDSLNTILASVKDAEARALEAVSRAEKKLEEANTVLDTAQKEVEVAKQSAAEAVSEASKASEANAEAQKALTETKVLAGDVKTGLASKQDKLTAGKNIKIEGRVISAEVPESAFGIDGTTIKRNARNTITAVAVKDEHKGTVMGFWQGTLSEYNAIKDRLPATTIAHIIDDAEVHLNLTEHDFVTNAVLESSLATKQPVGDYATNDALTAGLDSKQPVGDYVDAGEITDLIKAQIPTGVSAFVNDMGYVTESPDFSIYATKESVPTAVEEVLSTKDYASKADIPAVPTKTSELQNDAAFATMTELMDTEMDLRQDMNAKDSELQQQINSHATAISGKQDKFTVGEGLVLSGGNVLYAQKASATAFGTVKLVYTSGTGTLNIITG